jgi:starch-binding outer membrane protein, SusD/RagB family
MTNRRTMTKSATLALAGVLALGACDDLTAPDYANRELRELTENPTPAVINQAATGMVHNARNGATTYVLWGAIIGREGYFLDPNESRYVRGIFAGAMSGTNFTGNSYWVAPYRNIQLGHLIIHALDAVEMTAAEESAIRGFVKTMQALEFTQLLSTRDTIIIDTDHPLGEVTTPPPFATRAASWAHVAQLLDQAKTDLVAAGTTAMPFPTASGFTGFSNANTFLQFNRALKARVEVYRASPFGGSPAAERATHYAAARSALDSSFLSTSAPLTLGVYHAYSGNSGDVANTLFDPSGRTVADSLLPLRAPGDRRITTKVDTATTVNPPTVRGLDSNLLFTLYPSLSSKIPIIRNEELILLRAEARWFLGDHAGAMADLNFVRTTSGGLTAIATPATDAEFITALLYERRQSLLFEGGHSWIDYRRFQRLVELEALATQRVGGGSDVVATWMPLPSNEVLPRL